MATALAVSAPQEPLGVPADAPQASPTAAPSSIDRVCSRVGGGGVVQSGWARLSYQSLALSTSIVFSALASDPGS